MKSTILAVAVAATSLGFAGDGFAQSRVSKARMQPLAPPVSYVPNAAYFVGLGGSFNSLSYGNQNIYAEGVSNIYQNGVQVAYGSAGGPTTPYLDNRSILAPMAQAGYFQHFAGSDWLWGGKITYTYLNAHSTDNRVRDPQVGSFSSATPNTFTGNVIIGSYQSGITHQINFIPFLGHSFERSMVYAGVGPSLSQVKSSLNNVVGFAAIDGQHLNITGTPSNFSSTQWVWGGVATIGGTYYIDRSWFIDVNYSFGVTQNKTSDFSGPFASATDGYTDTGILSGNWSGHITTQTVAISINKAF
ncbi:MULTISPECIES: hypothetical protein [Rhodopseudomonas]|uniref:hypothetical protein n=1 Tax=Rhodopseudomonas TaxID=1073 RepID=UPI0006986017|nr:MULTISPECIES: hypothetical protein [Rhodopseudomonas]MDF3812906.1 hypothetical protein [Rhodopseudomonas sp. BAL398]WOK18515.1 hypothetical protein RBJ75_03015 [Rhodopseudomonas sp. BAL398]